jgi:uncharacterized membrane protein (DUF485 family)
MKRELTGRQSLVVAIVVLVIGEFANFFIGGLFGQSVATACELGFLCLLVISVITGIRNRKK